MSKKHFIMFANWIAANTERDSDEEQAVLRFVLDVAPRFNERFDGARFVAWIDKQRKLAA